MDIRDTGVYDGSEWVGTPLADTLGYVGLIQKTIGELTTAGGTVTLDAGGSVVMQQGSQVNVSGGWIDYQGGVVQTSEVITNGHIYPINKATPDLVYQGFNLGTFTVNSPKYGLSDTYTNPLIFTSHYENSYVEGFGGGTLKVTAPSTALDGQMIGLTVDGPRQLQQSQLASPSQFDLSFETETGAGAIAGAAPPPVPPNVIFSTVNDLPAASPFSIGSYGLDPAREKTVILSPDLVSSDGFGTLNISNGDGNVTVPAGVSLKGQPDGSITVAAANIDIQGSITAPGGSFSFITYDFDPFTPIANLTQTPPYNPGRGLFTLGASAVLDTSGLLIDDRPYVPGADTEPVVTAGGHVSITSLDANLESGSVINVSGGVEMQTSGAPAYGNGGSIAILAGKDPRIASLPHGRLMLDTTLLAYSGATGGSLSLQAPLVQIGGASGNPATLVLSPDFFSQGGFTSFTLSGVGASKGANNFLPAIKIAPGAQIDPVVTSMTVVLDSEGSGLSLQPIVLPLGERPPVSLAFNAPGLTDPILGLLLVRGDILMGAGSVIQTGPLGNVSFNGQTVEVLGGVYAPGGTISVNGANNSASLLFASSLPYLPTVDLGRQSVLSTAGMTIYIPDVVGSQDFTAGSVLPGGKITVAGNILAEAGAVLNVSGASATLDLAPNYTIANGTPAVINISEPYGSLLEPPLVPTRVDSSGGTISLAGGQELFTDATMLGAAGGPSAAGGTLMISSALGDASVAPNSPTLTVTQDNLTFHASGQGAIGHVVVNAKGVGVNPSGYFGVSTFLSGGFSSLALEGSVLFQGPVDINASGSLFIATGGVIESNNKVTLQAPYVALGQPFQAPVGPTQSEIPFNFAGSAYTFAPQYGTGSLEVIASLIDIGNLSLQDIGKASFIANNGDIRGDGTLDIAGNITMKAGQVYPATGVTFTIAAYDYTSGGSLHDGSVKFVRSGNRETPLSAGGTLDVYASDIIQGGVLRAPGGVINLGWDGSGTQPGDPISGLSPAKSSSIVLSAGSITSVSEIDSLTGQPLIIPYGIIYNGTDWIDPSGTDITTGGVPSKKINISSATVHDDKGATIDIRGGGDLMAYRFVPGILGSSDILASTSSFAIIPGYQAAYAPYAPYNPNPLTHYFNGDPGYVNSTLQNGQQVYLDGQGSLPAGLYTLLPARYALLPGAYLVTPQGGAPVGDQTTPDGSYIVSGYEVNSFQAGVTAKPLLTSFQVQSSAVVAQRGEYDLSGAAIPGLRRFL